MCKLKLSKYIVIVPRTNTVTILSTRTGALISIENDGWDKLLASEFKKVPRQTLSLLREAKILVEDNCDELKEVLATSRHAIDKDEVIDVVITPSAQCPLGCNLVSLGGYCGQTHKNEYMSESTWTGVVKQIEAFIAPQHRRIYISWFGGEPLMGMDVIRGISNSLLIITANRGLAYEANLTSGGTLLTLDIARELFEKHQVRSIGITLDGVAAVHDARRGTKTGKPTFDRIVQNLNVIRADPTLDKLRIAIRCNVDTRNLSDVDNFIDFVIDQKWIPRFDIYFSPVHPWGDFDNKDKTVCKKAFAEREIIWNKRLIEVGSKPELMPRARAFVCRVVTPNRVVFGHDGKIHRCTESPLTPYGNLKDVVGTVNANGKAPIRFSAWNWLDDIESAKYPCTNCNVLPMCGGGCPLSWKTGSDSPCPSFKFNMEQRIEQFLDTPINDESCKIAESRASKYSVIGLAERHWGQGSLSFQLLAQVESQLRIERAAAAQGFHIHARKGITNLLQNRAKYTEDFLSRKFFTALILASDAYISFKESDFPRAEQSTIEVVRCLYTIGSRCLHLDVRPAQIQSLLNLVSVANALAPQFATKLVDNLQLLLSANKAFYFGPTLLEISNDTVNWETEKHAFLSSLTASNLGRT